MEEIARVYSRALFEVAREHDELDVVHEELDEFADTLASNRDLQVFFFSPYFSSQEKEDGLARAVEGATETLMNFLRLLIEKHRMPVLLRIRREYDRLWQDAMRLLPVEVTSAIELDQETIAQIVERIGERTQRRIELTTHVEPDILGGIIVRVGNAILDASIRSRLDQLRKQVAAG